MANVLVDEQYLKDIAKSIRDKNGTQDKYKPGEMDDAIEAITTDKPDQDKTVTPSTQTQTVVADEGYELGQVIVEGDSDLISSNIKAGVNIFGVNGKTTVVDTEDANATADDIISPKTAYVNGEKITGTMQMTSRINPDVSIISTVYSLNFTPTYNCITPDNKCIISTLPTSNIALTNIETGNTIYYTPRRIRIIYTYD